MELTRQERRALRVIEEALDAENPALADLLRAPAAQRRAQLLRKLAWMSAVTSALLMLVGMVLSSGMLVAVSLLALLVVPASLWCGSASAAVHRSGP